jgi:WD40 repeat protein
MPVEYIPLRVDGPVLNTYLLDGDSKRFPLARGRMNLMTSRQDTLYIIAHIEPSYAVVYSIVRSGHRLIELRAVRSHAIEPETHVNNVVLAKIKDGTPYLLATGGRPMHPAAEDVGSLTFIPLPHVELCVAAIEPIPRFSDIERDNDTVNDADNEFRTRRTAQLSTWSTPATTIALTGFKSAWGLDTIPGTDLVCVSSNSHCVLLYEIAAYESRSGQKEAMRQGERLAPSSASSLSLRLVSRLTGHFGNIPCCVFSPTSSPRLILSASIDTSFCLFSADLNARLYQDMQNFATFEYDGGWGWSACFLSDVLAKPVDIEDPVWLAAFSSRSGLQPGWLLTGIWKDLREKRALHEVQHRCVESSAGDADARPPKIPVYDDGDEDSPNEIISGDDGLGSFAIGIGYSSGARWIHRDNESCTSSASGLRVQVGRTDDEGGGYFVVGRASDIDLYHQKETCGRMSVTLIQRLSLGTWRHQVGDMRRIVSIIKVPSLSLLVVASHRGPVFLVRLISRLCRCCKGRNQCRETPNAIMIVEARIAGTGVGDIAGVCVNERHEHASYADYSCELFVVRTTGNIQCYLLSRQPSFGSVDVAATIS